MNFKIQNKSQKVNSDLLDLMNQFIPHSQRELQWDQDVTVTLVSDKENSSNPLGKTAYYSPESFEVVLYTDGRHVKDILRSLSHELVHHNQNCHGNFGDPVCETSPGYAQSNKHLRKMEKEAYLRGNIIFRDWEDSMKASQNESDLYLVEKYLFRTKENNNMSAKEWMHRERFNNLSERWGIEADFDKIFEGLGHGEPCGCENCENQRELDEIEGDAEDLIDMGVPDDDVVGDVPHVDSVDDNESEDLELQDYLDNVDFLDEDPNLGLWEDSYLNEDPDYGYGPERGESYDEYLARTQPNPRRDAYRKQERASARARQETARETMGKSPDRPVDWNRKPHNPLSELESDIEARNLREGFYDKFRKNKEVKKHLCTIPIGAHQNNENVRKLEEKIIKKVVKGLREKLNK